MNIQSLINMLMVFTICLFAGCSKRPAAVRARTASDVLGIWRYPGPGSPFVVDIDFRSDGSFLQIVVAGNRLLEQQSGRWRLTSEHLELDEALYFNGQHWVTSPLSWDFAVDPANSAKLIIVGGADLDPDMFAPFVRINRAQSAFAGTSGLPGSSTTSVGP
jgi:hypothetical protein